MRSLTRTIVYAFPVLAVLASLCIAYSYFIEPDHLVVNSHELKIKDLSKEFDGLKIVAVSDIHGGSRGGEVEKIQRIVKTVNEQNPDIIVLLGDFVSEKGEPVKIGEQPLLMDLETLSSALTGFRAKYGTYAVLGNHDYWHSDSAVANALERAKIVVLENEIIGLNINGVTLRILGLKDHMHIKSQDRYNAEVRKVVENSVPGKDIVILQHSPDVFPIVAGTNKVSNDIRLFLAGHTHGGQVWLPILGTPMIPSSYGQKYARGHIRENDVDMFVTTGTGTSLLPFRFMMPPEIAVLTLRSSN
ncbi:MAG: metallophosphoesterase [Blastocatellia bacterium]|nr:metallophosphoesterase [Blastocatellia bacterium]